MTTPPNLVPALFNGQHTAQPGDDVYLGSTVVKLHLWGMVSDLDTPAMMSGSFEVLGDEGALVLDALVGPRGPAGKNSPIVNMQWSASIRDPNDLPKNLLNDPVDIGKAWWIGNLVWVWDGFRFQIHEMGSQGPAGPVPRIAPSVELLNPDGPEDSEVVVSGTSTRPSMLFRLKVPRGPEGPAASIRRASDWIEDEDLEAGQVITVIPGPAPFDWRFAARDFTSRYVRMYSVPEDAFQNFSGFANRRTILAYTVEPQKFDWVPYCSGHIRAFGIELDRDPLSIGVEVRLGAAVGGTLVARGHGASFSNWVTLSSHFSEPGNPTAATSPTNGVGMVRAGEAAQIFVNLFNDGLFGMYLFNRRGAQLTILTVPQEIAF